MSQDTHCYQVRVEWTGNSGTGTSSYRAYKRDHEIGGEGKAQTIFGSSDPAFRGDASRYNPEELLVASLSACHMLWYLHLCADAGIVVTAYRDEAGGEMRDEVFQRVILRPEVAITDPARIEQALALHSEAHARCFIAKSVRFPVSHEPRVTAV